MSDVNETLRAAIQAVLDSFPGDWTITNFCIPMGVERFHTGEFESTVWLYEAPFQASYITDGLLMRAEEIQHSCVDEDTD